MNRQEDLFDTEEDILYMTEKEVRKELNRAYFLGGLIGSLITITGTFILLTIVGFMID